MSQADSPTPLANGSDASASSGASPEAVPSQETEWQTVSFPGALSVDGIPREAIEAVRTQAVDPSALDAAALIQWMQHLQSENHHLRDRLLQTEQDLTQEQVQRQMVETCLQQQEPIPATMDATPVAVQAQQMSQLFQELELSHQTAQRQQILVETLKEQLEGSHERIAQLERECALTQERYNEQLQKLLQSENTCRDLRMRLYRQQQQTLQFKAALEKSLEMASPADQIRVAENGTAQENPAIAAASEPLTQRFTPQHHPVKPWSAAPPNSEQSEAADAHAFLAAKLLNQSPEPDQNPDPAIAQASAEPPITLLFPETRGSQDGNIARAVTPNTIFDLAPFLEAGELTAAMVSQEGSLGDFAPRDAIAEPPVEEDPLWVDLARLINAVEADAQHSLSGENAPAAEPAERTTEVPPTEEIPDPAYPESASHHRNLDLLTLKFRQRQPQAETVEAPNPLVETAAVMPEAAEDAESWLSDAAVVPGADAPNWPSPVLYPARPVKKLSSLAAVDLPSFPRR